MRIAYVSGGRLDSFMADVVHILQSVDALSQLGHDVMLFAQHGDLDPDCLQSRYDLVHAPRCLLMTGLDWRQPWRRLSRIGNALAMARRVRKTGNFDVVLGREPYSIWPLLGRGSRIVYEAHEMPGGFLRPVLDRLFSHPDFERLVVISSSLRDDYCATFPLIEREKISVIPCSVQHSAIARPFSPVDVPGRPEAPKVGFIGALYPGKGMEVVLPMASRFPGCDFHIVGGRTEDVAYWKNQLPPSNVFFHGLRPRCEVFGYLDAFDVVLLPSQPDIQTFSGRTTSYGRWTSPMKLFEYMARGKAIVASDLPGISDVVTDGVTALLVPPSDLSAWQAAIDRLIVDRPMREQIGMAAQVNCEARFTSIACAKVLLKALNS